MSSDSVVEDDEPNDDDDESAVILDEVKINDLTKDAETSVSSVDILSSMSILIKETLNECLYMICTLHIICLYRRVVGKEKRIIRVFFPLITNSDVKGDSN